MYVHIEIIIRMQTRSAATNTKNTPDGRTKRPAVGGLTWFRPTLFLGYGYLVGEYLSRFFHAYTAKHDDRDKEYEHEDETERTERISR